MTLYMYVLKLCNYMHVPFAQQTWSSFIPSIEFLASPIWLRSILVDVANPGVIVPGVTDIFPG